jgi:hypothetical protein
MIDIKQPKHCEIKIDGHLSDQRARSFEVLQITTLANGETLLSGEIKDQSQLFGILIRIRDIGAPLLSVNINNQQVINSREINDEHCN